jgi:hypothetical protein
METLAVRYSVRWLAGFCALWFLGATAVTLVEAGPAAISEPWSYLIIWVVMFLLFVPWALLVWAIPAARLHRDRVTSVAYPFSIRWSDVSSVRVTSFFRLNWVKVYGRNSRFALWIPMPTNQIQAIHAFLMAHAKDAFSAAFSDKRLNRALQRTASLSLGHR